MSYQGKEAVNDYIEANEADILISLWESDNNTINEAVEWALTENPELLMKVLELARTKTSIKVKIDCAIEAEAEERLADAGSMLADRERD